MFIKRDDADDDDDDDDSVIAQYAVDNLSVIKCYRMDRSQH